MNKTNTTTKRSKQVKSAKPLVSVVMPVYNAVSYVAEAIASIQQQTYQNWELLIVDDISTDGSYELVKKIASSDKRIKVFRNGVHRGVASVGNYILKKSKGDLVARMDADDISMPDRLANQVAYLQENPETVLVGGQCDVIDQHGNVTGSKRFPTNPEAVYRMMFHSIPVQQPSVMVNTSLLPKDFVWYEEGLRSAEEVELLFRLFKYGSVANLDTVALKYRIHGSNVSLKDPKKTFYATIRARLHGVTKHGYRPTIAGMATTLAQLLVVSVLPSSWIYPVYSFIRGMKQFTLEMDIAYRRFALRLVNYPRTRIKNA